MNRALALAIVLAAGTASADGGHVMVLHAEGSGDARTRAAIDAEIIRLARNLGGNVEPGDISLADASAAVGCDASDPSCASEVVTTLGVDELVATKVTAGPDGELRVTVRRLTANAPREASSTIHRGERPGRQLAADIGPLFGVTAPPPPAEPEKPTPAATTPAPIGERAHPTTAAPAQPRSDTSPTVPAAPPRTAQAPDTVTAAPDGQVTTAPEGHSSRRRLEIAGMAAGGGLVLLSFAMWAEASSTQQQIDAAPTRTPADFRNLQDLESRADSYAGAGNVFFLGGVALGAVAGYYFWRDHRADHATQQAQQARLAPAVFPHGAGLALTIGGGP